MRDTERKRAILQLLEQHDEADYLEHWPPPYTATAIARRIGGSVQSVARTLRGMAKDGLLVAVRERQDTWNAIAQRSMAMTVTAYFSARTMSRDVELAAAWRNGAAARSRVAGDRMVAAFSQR
jgi:hypothetical protein